MEKFTIIKNGLVLTLDRKGLTGYFNIIIKNNKIFLIDFERKFNEKEFTLKNPDAEIIDATGKLIMPGFFNSRLISAYSLNKIFFRKCSYQNINSWLSLKLIENYLSNIENAETLRDLLKISYLSSLKNGEIFLNECSPVIGKDFFDVYFADYNWIKQYYNLSSHDFKIPVGQDGKISFSFITDENINNYSLTSVRKSLSENRIKLFIGAYLSEQAFESIKKVFGKSYITVLAEMDLISENTIISNPTHLNPHELEILKQKRSTILISPSDYKNLSYKKADLDEYISSGVNIIIGTGHTGNDILSELKILSTMISKNTATLENILNMAVYNPSLVFGVSNITGSIERNRYADMIFYDLKDLRNTLMLPETDKENVIEFIFQKLSAKDISDVMIKGEFMVKNNEVVDNTVDSPAARSNAISQKIYSAGKYFEFKEKYLMRGRVDRISLDGEQGSEAPVKEEIFVDMTETGEYVGEGEFTILGTKEEEFEKPRERDIFKKAPQGNLQEIKSLETDLNLFEGIENLPDSSKSKKVRKKIVREKPAVEEFSNEISQEEIEYDESNPEDGDVRKEEVVSKESQKSKLKFGFSEGE